MSLGAAFDDVQAIELERLLGPPTLLRAVHQPIIDLRSGETVAYEALVRGPAGSPLEMPGPLFDTATRVGRLAELDWVARSVATPELADLPDNLALFVNVEPATMSVPPPPYLEPWTPTTPPGTRIVIEITERAMSDDPASLISSVRSFKRRGLGIAVDDVGAHPASLALLPFLRPDVIKLDMQLIQQESQTAAEIAATVRAEAERSGSLVLAEGVETEEHEQRALAFGARLAQGYRYGRPATQTSFAGDPGVVPNLSPVSMPGRSPADALAAVLEWEVTPCRFLVPVMRTLEDQALRLQGPPIVLGAFESPDSFDDRTAALFARLAQRSPLVGVVSRQPLGLPAGVRSADLKPDDPVSQEWVLAVVGSHFTGALIATRVDRSEGPDGLMRFSVTYQREAVLTAARHLMSRLTPSG